VDKHTEFYNSTTMEYPKERDLIAYGSTTYQVKKSINRSTKDEYIITWEKPL